MTPEPAPKAFALPRLRPGHLALALGAVVVVLLPLLFPNRYAANLLILGASWGIATLGLVVVLGYTGQISLAQAAFYGIGAYAVALGTTALGVNWWLALVLGLLAATLAGAGLGSTTLKIGGHYLAMVTICFQIIYTLITTNWVAVTGGPDGISNIKRPPFLFPLTSAQRYAWFALGALLLVAGLVWWLRDTALGRAMRAIRENELAAEALGVDTRRVKVIAFTLSAVIGALGGAIYASGYLYISPDSFNFDHAVSFLAMALVGGSASPLGSILGAGLLAYLPEWLRDLKRIYLVVYGCAIILVIVFMPEGLWGYVKLMGRRFAQARRPSPGASGDAGGQPRHRRRRDPPGREPGQALRRTEGGGWRGFHGLSRRDPRAHRPQRVRQDDLHQPAFRPLRTHLGAHPLPRPGHRGSTPQPHCLRLAWPARSRICACSGS